jgi:hypothetical protein
MAVTTEAQAGATAIRPFTVEISDADVEDLRTRIVATRLPDKEPVEDSSQGVQLATMQALVRYWGTEYSLRPVTADGTEPGLLVAKVAPVGTLGLLPWVRSPGSRSYGVFVPVDRPGA